MVVVAMEEGAYHFGGWVCLVKCRFMRVVGISAVVIVVVISGSTGVDLVREGAL